MPRLAAICLILSGILACQPAPPPRSGNPILPGWYADPEVARLGDRYWIFPTYSAAYEDQVFFDAFSSPDLVHWDKHPRVLDTAAFAWARRALWAPCVVPRDGRYYFFFAANDLQTPEGPWWEPGADTVGGIGIGVADAPEGPYTDYLGEPLIGAVYQGAQPIDQYVFQDKDGSWYIVYGGWGHCNLARLQPDFRGLLPWDDGELVREITPPGYVEGPVLFHRAGWYYLMWSEGNWTDGSYRVAYGRARQVAGPYAKAATILTADPAVATGAGHHSVLHVSERDEWYIVYHRRPIPNEGRDHRVTCIDRLYFDAEGAILPVQMTFEGVPAVPVAAKN